MNTIFKKELNISDYSLFLHQNGVFWRGRCSDVVGEGFSNANRTLSPIFRLLVKAPVMESISLVVRVSFLHLYLTLSLPGTRHCAFVCSAQASLYQMDGGVGLHISVGHIASCL